VWRRRLSGSPSPSGSSAGSNGGSAYPGEDEPEPNGRLWWAQNLEHSLPILIAGVAFVGIAIAVHLSYPSGGASRFSLWTLLVAIGIVLAGGGFALTIVEEPEKGTGATDLLAESSPDGEYVRVDRSEWERIRQQAALRAPWDESLTAPLSRPMGATARLPAIGTPPAGSANAESADPVSVGSDLVQEISEMLLTSAPPSAPDSPRPQSRPGAEGAPQTPLADRLAKPQAAPAAFEESGVSAAAASDRREVWEESERDVSTSSRPRPSRPPTTSCAGCGGLVREDDDSCVVCDRPMCSGCHDRAFEEGHPGLCPECEKARRAGSSGLS
jgi:hypothetical protein